MGKARYILGVLIGAAGIIGGIVWAVMSSEGDMFLVPYAIGAFLANIIWFDGPVITVASFGFRICAMVFSFFFGTGIGCLLFLFAPIAITICAGVLTFTLIGVSVTAFVMFPINTIRFSRDLY